MMHGDLRKAERKPCYGKIFFTSSGDVPGYIRDISQEGMRVECPLPLVPETKKTFIQSIKVLPDEDAEFSPFSATVEIRWLQRTDLYLIVGLQIREIDEKAEKEYAKILAAYNAHSSVEG